MNLDAGEIQRQKEFRQQGLQTLAPVVLPEGELEAEVTAAGGIRGHLGWPHAVMIDSVIVLHVRNLFFIRSADAGQTWGKPLFVKNAPILVMVATKSGKLVAVGLDRLNKNSAGNRQRSLSVLISEDKGKSWKRHSAKLEMPVGAQALTSRVIEHPKYGLVTGVHYNIRKDTLTFLLSSDEGQTWRSESFPVNTPLNNNGMVVFADGDNNLCAFTRNQVGVGSASKYLAGWTAHMQYVPVNAATAKGFGDLKWSGVRSNIWERKR
ncbi:MAG: sialidase family protein [Bacteroidota bacterium]